ncbi:hypothetical protein D9M69_518490 [compost metagenome]
MKDLRGGLFVWYTLAMGYNSNLSSKQNAALNSAQNSKKYIIGKSLRLAGIIGLVISALIVLSTGNIGWGIILLLAMSAFTLPALPILLLAIGQYLLSESKK